MEETFGRFAAAAVEFIICGILFVTACVVTLTWLLHLDLDQSLEDLRRFNDLPAIGSLGLLLGGAYAYMAGVFAETLGRVAFEWRLNHIKSVRAARLPSSTSHGDARALVMARSAVVYLEIDSQLKRLRIERVLAVLTRTVVDVGRDLRVEWELSDGFAQRLGGLSCLTLMPG